MATQFLNTHFQLKRGLAEAWDRNNPILADGEPGWTLDTHILKIGDGATPWKDLEPIGGEEITEADVQRIVEQFVAEKNYKTKQTAISSPSATNDYTTEFIDTIIQDDNGVITPTKKKVQVAWNNVIQKPSIKAGTGTDSVIENGATNASGDYSHAEGDKTSASGVCSHAEGYNTRASSFFSHAEGKSTKAFGYCSHAEGEVTEAYGSSSHTEGYDTIASGDCSHAEGSLTKASGEVSHAEGRVTTASGEVSHAEGYRTDASGKYSHAEGEGILPKTATLTQSNTHIYKISNIAASQVAIGQLVLVPGTTNWAIITVINPDTSQIKLDRTLGALSNTEVYIYDSGANLAIGGTSHTEGKGIVATGNCSHAQGKFNIIDSTVTEETPFGTFAHIVGNGTDKAPSNAHVLDWSGNAYFKGKVYANGQNNDATGGSELATVSYVNDIVQIGISKGWYFRKWRNGVVECWKSITQTVASSDWTKGKGGSFGFTVLGQTIGIQSSALTKDIQLEFPTADAFTFTERPTEIVNISNNSSWRPLTLMGRNKEDVVTLRTTKLYNIITNEPENEENGLSVTLDFYVIGKWK